ncbi:MAG: flagellar motor protein MotB [Gemmatimonadales bacterium]|nr:MAG: flagellar motor protein MotB [Gemmatimonadales bacterium]
MKSPRGEGRIVIVVRKRTREPEGHHGGAWKVAYADFVTAMMAFFLVMWIMGMGQESRDLVQGYFNNPLGVSQEVPSGLNPVTAGGLFRMDPGSGLPGSGFLEERQLLEGLAHSLDLRLLEAGVGEVGAQVEMTVSAEGLRIELMELGPEEVLFDRSGHTLRPALQGFLQVIARELAALPHQVVVEGHTDATPFLGVGAYSNWELSMDRANAARRALLAAGLHEDRVVEVRGHADRVPRVPGNPLDHRNRRVSLVLPFLEATSPGFPASEAENPLPWPQGPLPTFLMEPVR